MDILIMVITFGLGFFAGSATMLHSVRKTINRIANKLAQPADGSASDEELTNMQHNFRVQEVPMLHTEKYQDTLFLYHNSMFVCQGTSLADLAVNSSKVAGMAKVAMVKHDEEHMWFVDGEVQNNI